MTVRRGLLVSSTVWVLAAALGLGMLAACGGKDAGDATSGKTPGSTRPGERVPVVLISIDTLRSDHLPAYGYDGVETPALDRFAADGVVFERAYSHYPLTLPSHLTMLTGRLPADVGVRDNTRYVLREDVQPFLPSLLHDAGYATAATVSTYALRADSGISRDFDLYDAELSQGDQRLMFADEREGADTLAAALPWLRRHAGTQPVRPFFLFFHIYEPHLPHTPPEPFASRYGDTYDGEIATADAVVGQLLDELRRLGLYERALILLVSDHGEEFGEHGEEGHGILLYRQSLQVVMMMKLPGLERAGSRWLHPVQLSDVLPTVADVVGLDTGGAELAGRSLLRTLDSDPESASQRPVFAETIYPRIHYGWHELTSLIQGERHLISGVHAELFDPVADPAEEHDLLSDERRTYHAMAAVLEELRTPYAGPTQEEDPETLQRLASLGYLSSSVSDDDASLLDPRGEIAEITPLMSKAQKLLFDQRQAEAEPLFRQLLARNPHMPDTWESLGLALKAQERWDEAFEAYARALEISGSPQAAILAGEALLELGRLDEAEEHLLLAWAAGREASRDMLVAAELKRGDLAAAVDWSQKAGGLETLSRPILLRLVRALAVAGRMAEAKAAVDVLVRSEPSAEAWNEAARLRIETGDPAGAQVALDRAMALEPRNAGSLEWLGLMKLQQGALAEAEAMLEESVGKDGQRANAWNLLAVARFQRRDVEGAVMAWQEAVRLDPSHLDALYNLGLTAARMGRRDLALRSLRSYAEAAASEPGRAAELTQVRGMIRQLEAG